MSAAASAKTEQKNRLFISNMHLSLSEGELIRLFQTCGSVKKIDYCWNKFGPNRGQPKGFAFVEMSTDSEADVAINKMNHRIIKGRKLFVQHAHENDEKSSSNVFTPFSRPRVAMGNKEFNRHSSASITTTAHEKVVASMIGKRSLGQASACVSSDNEGSTSEAPTTVEIREAKKMKGVEMTIEEKIRKVQSALKNIKK